MMGSSFQKKKSMSFHHRKVMPSVKTMICQHFQEAKKSWRKSSRNSDKDSTATMTAEVTSEAERDERDERDGRDGRKVVGVEVIIVENGVVDL